MSCSQEEKFPLYSKYVVFCHITLPCTLYREIFKCHSLTKQYLFSYYDKSGVTFQKYLVTKHLICNSCIFKANYMLVSWCTLYSSRSSELLSSWPSLPSWPSSPSRNTKYEFIIELLALFYFVISSQSLSTKINVNIIFPSASFHPSQL